MEPRIQYAKTSDGFSIAFMVSGSGPPLLHMSQPGFPTLQARAAIPAYREFDQRIEQSFEVIRYDSRGCGLSTRKIDNLRLDEMLRDAEAVVDRLGLEEFSIFAEFDCGPPAIAFAHQYPDRVKKLVLWCTWARTLDVLDKDVWMALTQLIDHNLQLYLETVVQGFVGGTGLDPREVVQPVLSGVDQANLRLAVTDAWSLDVSELVGELKCPCLVLHRQGLFFPAEQSARLAAAIPDGRLIVLPGPGGVPWAGETEPVIDALESFLLPQAADAKAAPSGTAVILFADIADSTALTERLGDAAFRAKARDVDTALRTVIRDHNGTPIEGKLLGDGVLAVFTSARQAIEAALACARSGDDAGLPLHIGLHAGDVIREENNVYGGAVNIASRISGLSAPGQVLVSDIVRGLARTSVDVAFAARGDQRLKGVSDSVRVWAVKPLDAADAGQPLNATKLAYPDHLTTREVQVLRLIAAGRTNAEISRELVLSQRTVARHITNIYGKIGARSKVDAASYALRHGLTVEH